MKKIVGIIGTALLVCAVSLVSPRYVAKAANNIVETGKLPELLTYEDFCLLYTCREDIRYSDPKIIEVDQEDAVRLMKIGQCEAGETDFLSIAYVMKVVLNRVENKSFPDSIDGVIHQKLKNHYQFSTVANGVYDSTVPNVNAHYALYLLESGQIDIESKWFEADWVKDSWQSRHKTFEFEYAGHRYYK